MGAAGSLARERSRSRDFDEAHCGLVQRVAAQDADALAMLYDATSPFVYGLALRIVRDQGAAEEVTLDAYMQVWRDARRFDAERGSAVAWLLTIARSRAIDRLRASARGRTTMTSLDAASFVADPGPGPEGESIESERRARILGAMAQLPIEQREAIRIAYFSGMSHSEIAEALGQPLGTVKTRIRLGMMRLRDILSTTAEELES